MINVSRFGGKSSDYKRVDRNAETVAVKHLAGKHDQSTHGRGGGVSAPRDSSRAKQKQAWDLYQQGKTWEEVAKEVGYANGGAARLAGKAHEKRMKGKDGDDKPKLDDPPKPKVDAGGAEEIARAKDIVDEATGGLPVKQVLTLEQMKVATNGEPPTAKELEVTEAVIKAGAVLRGEVQRRREVAGAEPLKTAKAELDVILRDKASHDKEVTNINAERLVSRNAVTKEMMRSPEMTSELNRRLDDDFQVSRNAKVKGLVENNRDVVLEDLRDYATLDRDLAGMVGNRDVWLSERAKQRFPNDFQTQESYISVLRDSSWASVSVERSMDGTDTPLGRLIAVDKGVKQRQNDAYKISHDFNREINQRQRLIRDGGVTPEQDAEIIRSVLQDAGRTMTDKPNQRISGTKPTVVELRSELVKIPDELWNDQQFTGLRVKATTKGRGHFSASEQEIKTDGAKGSGRRASTLLHEATHAVESMNPQITQLQFVMLTRRAKGRQPEPLRKVTPRSGYRKDEKTIKDEFSEPYSGKVYGFTRRSNYEIMTMGIESLYKRETYPSIIADDDHLNFVMGVLAYA
jgi:hypothetical protein